MFWKIHVAQGQHHKTAKQAEIAERRARVAVLYAEGQTQPAIASELGVGVGTVNRDIRAIEQMWVEQALGGFDRAKATQINRLQIVWREAYDAWCASKAGTEQKRAVKTSGGDGGETNRAERTQLSSVGDPRFLSALLSVLKQHSELLGLDAPFKVAQTDVDGTAIEFDASTARAFIIAQLGDDEKPDGHSVGGNGNGVGEIDGIIKRIEHQPDDDATDGGGGGEPDSID